MFSLLLFGNVIQYFPYFLYAFECMGRNGLGRRTEQGRATFVLQEVNIGKRIIYSPKSEKLPTPLPHKTLSLNKKKLKLNQPPSHIRINLLSPLRVKIGGKFASDLDFVEFIKIVLRRLRMLICEFSENEWNVDESQLIQLAKSNNKQDSEWALVQLTKMSIQGKNINNFEIHNLN